ncbi:MAG: hypothetical protein JW850_21180 [Thermoflexales bacterium]|nr:hypothetical protein [Thermoflexales bacterium]
MLKCSRCKQYYIPGYLDCQCRVARALLAANAQASHPIKDQATAAAWSSTNIAVARDRTAAAHKAPANVPAKPV